VSLLPWWVKAIVIGGALLLAGAALRACKASYDEDLRAEGRLQVQAKWDAADLATAQANAKETQRRLDRQQENQRAQDALLAAAREDAARNAADAQRVREQAAGAAREWSARLADAPTGQDLQAAAAAITVLTDVRSRLDAAATELASYATSARAAGLKCEADYDALIPSPTESKP
jgi:hypothetical protein